MPRSCLRVRRRFVRCNYRARVGARCPAACPASRATAATRFRPTGGSSARSGSRRSPPAALLRRPRGTGWAGTNSGAAAGGPAGSRAPTARVRLRTDSRLRAASAAAAASHRSQVLLLARRPSRLVRPIRGFMVELHCSRGGHQRLRNQQQLRGGWLHRIRLVGTAVRAGYRRAPRQKLQPLLALGARLTRARKPESERRSPCSWRAGQRGHRLLRDCAARLLGSRQGRLSHRDRARGAPNAHDLGQRRRASDDRGCSGPDSGSEPTSAWARYFRCHR